MLANKDGDRRKTLRGNNGLDPGGSLRDQEKRYSEIEMTGLLLWRRGADSRMTPRFGLTVQWMATSLSEMGKKWSTAS